MRNARQTFKPMLRALFFIIVAGMVPLAAETLSAVVVFKDSGFPAADSGRLSPEQFQKLFPGARFASTDQLRAQLAASTSRLLVFPYGSAFPEGEWPTIFQFLQQGGNLLVLGGMPFTRAAYRDSSGWHLRNYSVRCTRPLMIDQYQETPGSEGLQFQTNPDVTIQLSAFTWKRALSPVISLSAVDLYGRGGSAGAIDARLDALAWGTKDGRELAAPAVESDHLRNGFDGGRWIFVNAELGPEFYANIGAEDFIHSLVDRATQGSEESTVRPVLPVYLQGEPVQVEIVWHSGEASRAPQALTETGWNHLLTYVNDGGNLLITGPVNRDEHCHVATRTAELSVDAETEPLTYHHAVLRFNHHEVPLSFDQQKQNWLEALRFRDGVTLKKISWGKGRIFWASHPVELAEGTRAVADLYAYVSGKVGITTSFDAAASLSPGVLLYPVVLQDSVLYVMVSESSDDTQIDVRDKLTGVRLTLMLAGQHAALALIGERKKRIIARYGF